MSLREWMSMTAKRCQLVFGRIRFYLGWPLAMARHKMRLRTIDRKIVPINWLSPATLLARDLDYFEGSKEHLNKGLLDEFAKARDDLSSRINKRLILSTTIFVYLLANFLSIGIDIKLPGIELKYIPGVPEGLLVFVSLIGILNMIHLNAVYTIESSMKYIINIIYPDELRKLYSIRYFPNEAFGPYVPLNIPHILPTSLTSFISINSARLFFFISIPTFIIYALTNGWFVYDLIANPKIPYVSRGVGVYVAMLGIYSFMYLMMTRFRLPYNDWVINHELELLQQIDPKKHGERLDEIYSERSAEIRRMREGGYIKDHNPGGDQSPPSSP